ncbi:CLUMA_CG004120, isoform A [Clunio marinus]|uniref:Amine oxidase n=1 Tax=Clunio marinus TaxID=568069 RepID=A0A1J1HQW3_9DIPT|nr:CLUMA_CG004120, isoform A [Clunio marinus]
MSLKKSLIVVIYILACSELCKSESHKIVIVGAGLSGMSTGAKLMENGIDDFVILEAEDRIGGRIHSVPFSNGFVDLGGQWIHGEKGNAIFEMVRGNFDLGNDQFYENLMDFRLSNGKFANPEQSNNLFAILYNLYEEAYSPGVKNVSLGEILETGYEKILKLLSEDEVVDENLAKQVFDLFLKQQNANYASNSLYDVSAIYNNYTQECEGNQTITWKTKGFKSVFDFITKKLPDPSKFLNVESKVQLNKQVININWDIDSNYTEEVKVTCSDGSTYTADIVVFTGSLGVLKARHEKLFTPKLPENKIKAIENIGFGVLGKVFLEFDEPFWPVDDNNWSEYFFLWNEDDLKNISSTELKWIVNVIGFFKLKSFPNVLEGMIVGDDSIKEFERFDDKTLVDQFTWLLEKFLGKKVQNPKAMIRNRWFSNDNFLGTYSYLTMESQKYRVTPDTLALPLYNSDGKLVVLFAGEATHHKYSSYSHGAVESGWKAGNEIAKYLSKFQ